MFIKRESDDWPASATKILGDRTDCDWITLEGIKTVSDRPFRPQSGSKCDPQPVKMEPLALKMDPRNAPLDFATWECINARSVEPIGALDSPRVCRLLAIRAVIWHSN